MRVAWWYLRSHPILVALPWFREALQRFAAAKGKLERYLTERLATSRDLSWDDFAARNADLLQWSPSVLKAFYSDQALASSRAREMFMLPETNVGLSAVQSVPARV